MQSRGCQPDDNVTVGNVAARQYCVALNGADRETGEVIVLALIDARHLRRLAADQGASRLAAAMADAFNDGGRGLRLKFPASVIIKKEEGLGALHYEVIHAHCDQINADGVVAAGFDCNLELGADAVGCRDQYRVAVANPLELEQSAKSADFGICARTGGSADQVLDQLHHPIAGIDINTGLRVSQTALFLCHYGPRSRRGRTLESQVAQSFKRRYTLTVASIRPALFRLCKIKHLAARATRTFRVLVPILDPTGFSGLSLRGCR